jgi:hypothetical protein
MSQEYFQTRFSEDARRDVMWQTLCRFYFSRLISPTDSVLELGAGYGCFINHVTQPGGESPWMHGTVLSNNWNLESKAVLQT